jgi:hypothetical protein
MILHVTEALAGGTCTSATGVASVAVTVASSAFHTLAPCRVIDTRSFGGTPAPIHAGFVMVNNVIGSCGIPADAKALSANITMVAATAPGVLHPYPTTLLSTPITGIPIAVGKTRAVALILQLATDGSGEVAFWNESPADLNLILDVNGYFR